MSEPLPGSGHMSCTVTRTVTIKQYIFLSFFLPFFNVLHLLAECFLQLIELSPFSIFTGDASVRAEDIEVPYEYTLLCFSITSP